MRIVVDEFWDDEARVWAASSVEGIGLATEADTIEALQHKLTAIIPDFLGEEHAGTIEIELLARSFQTIAA